MDKRTRVLNAINKLPVDHVPVGFWFHFYGKEAVGQACIDAHLKYYRESDLDLVKIMSDGYAAYPLPKISSIEDLKTLEPLKADDPFIKDQVDRAKAIVQAIGEERCVFYNVFAPLSFLRIGLEAQGGSDKKLMEYMMKDVKTVMKALDVIAESIALLSELVITEAGCDGIYYSVQNGEKGRFTPAQYHKFVSPSDLHVLERANRYSENNILHMCGWAGNPNQLELWQDYPVKIVNWATFVEGMGLYEGREFMKNRAILGGFETLWDGKKRQGLIYDGTKEEIQEYTKTLIREFGTRGLILGGDCTVDSGIDVEHLKWVVEAARSM